MNAEMKKHELRAKLSVWASMTAGLLLAGAATALLANCSFRAPAVETPVPSQENIEKSFFVKTEKRTVQVTRDGKTVEETKEVQVPKTFACGWASLNEVGFLSNYTMLHNVNMPDHCNIEFEITERYLIGRKINPTFPNEPNRWKQAVMIPIVSHFYLEKSKDRFGRDTNEIVENSSRSDWSARPTMRLDLSGTTVLLFDGSAHSWDGLSPTALTAVTDVEWDKTNGFFAFNATFTSPVFGEHNQGSFRFNFKEFTHNPEFKRTPYNDKNANMFNALHIMGQRIEGVAPVLYASHWDTSKKHEIYMYGFPDEYVSIGEESVENWNDAFEKIGHGRPFVLNKKKMKYPFDLRYPMMVWVEDKQISEYSPLGIGMSLADVKNGEILWGGIVLWGGGIERYVKSYMPGASIEGTQARVGAMAPKLLPLGQGFFTPDRALQLPKGLQDVGASDHAIRANFSAKLEETRSMATHELKKQLEQIEKSIAGQQSPEQTEHLSNARQTILEQIKAIESADQGGQKSAAAANAIVGGLYSHLGKLSSETNKFFAQASAADLFAFVKPSMETQKHFFGDKVEAAHSKELETALYKRVHADMRGLYTGGAIDSDRTFAHVALGWSAALNAQGSTEEYGGAVRKIVKELILHELGHFMGLGHQFKENILPARGTVPEKYVKALEVKAKENLTNFTSVMGYKSPETEIAMKYEDISHGPQDILTMRYLYNQEFAVFNGKDEDFTFLKLAEHAPGGEIPVSPQKKPGYRTTYFPNCNDFDASYSRDPYCNRFDRGYNAETIVKSYFESINANLVSRIYAGTDARGGNTEAAEGMLWYSALNTMGRVRLFYDYMRHKYAHDIESIAHDQDDLYAFSRACDGEVTDNKRLNEIFKSKPELRDLCRVNRMAIREMTKYLVNPGPDFSEIDYDNSYLSASQTGGDAENDYSRMFGTRRTLTVYPLKISAINALTTPRPYFSHGGWLVPIPRFSAPEAKYSYASLYPFEFTQAMAATVEKNLRFAANGNANATTMGQTVLSMGYFLEQIKGSNDNQRFPSDYLETIHTQTAYNFSMVAVVLTKVTRANDKNRATKFTVGIYDFRTNKTVSAPEAYVLPGGKVLVRGPAKTFIFPTTRLTFIDDTQAYVLAYKLDYEEKQDDVLAAHSVKATFEKLHKNALDACIVGQNNGLQSFFNSQTKPETFEGFEIKPGIATDKENQIKFLESVRRSFDKYYLVNASSPTPPKAATCEESLKGLGMIVSSAAVVNGFWLPEILNYMVK